MQVKVIKTDGQFMQATRQSNRLLLQRKERERECTLETSWDFVFRTGDNGTFAYTLQKHYIREFKFQLGQSITIKEYWSRQTYGEK